MRSRTKSSASKRSPTRWQRELRVQANLRRRINRAQRQFDRARLDAQRALSKGGKGWPSRVGTAELRALNAWNMLRELTRQLYFRKEVA